MTTVIGASSTVVISDDESTVEITEGGRGPKGDPGSGSGGGLGYSIDARDPAYGIVDDGHVGQATNTDNLEACRVAVDAWLAQGGGELHFPRSADGTGILQVGSLTGPPPQILVDCSLLNGPSHIYYHAMPWYIPVYPGWDDVGGTNQQGAVLRFINADQTRYVIQHDRHLIGPDRSIADSDGFAKNPYLYDPDRVGVGVWGSVGRMEDDNCIDEGFAIGFVVSGDHYRFGLGCSQKNCTIGRAYNKTENQKDDTGRGGNFTRQRLASIWVHPWFCRITDNSIIGSHMGQAPFGFLTTPTGLPSNDGETSGTMFRTALGILAGAHVDENFSDQCASGDLVHIWSEPDGQMGQPIKRVLLFGSDTIIETVDGVVRTLGAHELTVDDAVTIDNAAVSALNGAWFVESVPTPDSFTLAATLGGPQVATSQSGPGGSIMRLTNGVFSVTGGLPAVDVNDQVTVQGLGAGIDGAYFVLAVDNETFTLSDTLGGAQALVGIDAAGGSVIPLGPCNHARMENELPSGDQSDLVFGIERCFENYHGADSEMIVNSDGSDTTLENCANGHVYDARRKPLAQLKWQSPAGTTQLSGLDEGCQMPLSLADPKTPKYQGDDGHLLPAAGDTPGRLVDVAASFASGPEPVTDDDWIEILGLQVVGITDGVIETSQDHHMGQGARFTIYDVDTTSKINKAYWVREVISAREFTVAQQQPTIDDLGVVTLARQKLVGVNGTGGYIARAGADGQWIDSSTSPSGGGGPDAALMQAGTFASATATTTQTSALTNPVTAGNVLVAWIYSNLGATHIMPPAGYVLLGLGGSNPGIGALYGKVADGTETGATVTTDGAAALGIHVKEWEGVTLPADASGTVSFLADATATVDTSDDTQDGAGVALTVGYVTAGTFAGIGATGWGMDAWGRGLAGFKLFTLVTGNHAELVANWTTPHKGNITIVVLPPIPTDGPITVATKLDHGASVGDEIWIEGHDQLAVNGLWTVDTVPSPTELTLVGLTGQGTGGSTGYVYKRNPRGFFESTTPWFPVARVVDDTVLELDIDPGFDVGAGLAYRVVKYPRLGMRIGTLVECDWRWSHGETLPVPSERIWMCRTVPQASHLTFASPRHLARGSYFEEKGGEPPLFQILDANLTGGDLQDIRTIAESGDRELQLVRGAPGYLFRRGTPAAYVTDGSHYLAGALTEADSPILIGPVQYTAGWAQTLAWVVLRGGMWEVALAVPDGSPLKAHVYPDIPQSGGEALGFCVEDWPTAFLSQPLGMRSGPPDDLIIGYTPVDVRRALIPKVLALVDGGVEP